MRGEKVDAAVVCLQGAGNCSSGDPHALVKTGFHMSQHFLTQVEKVYKDSVVRLRGKVIVAGDHRDGFCEKNPEAAPC